MLDRIQNTTKRKNPPVDSDSTSPHLLLRLLVMPHLGKRRLRPTKVSTSEVASRLRSPTAPGQYINPALCSAIAIRADARADAKRRATGNRLLFAAELQQLEEYKASRRSPPPPPPPPPATGGKRRRRRRCKRRPGAPAKPQYIKRIVRERSMRGVCPVCHRKQKNKCNTAWVAHVSDAVPGFPELCEPKLSGVVKHVLSRAAKRRRRSIHTIQPDSSGGV